MTSHTQPREGAITPGLPGPSLDHTGEAPPLGTTFHLLCCLSYTLLCIGWSVWAGRDQSWDQLNYHLYVAHAWWHNRLPEEFFAASAQGYLNPLPHLPFYAAYATGWHSLIVSASLAGIHSINLWVLHFISVELTTTAGRLRRTMIVGGVLLGALTPAFLIETGSSFADVIVSIPSLATLLCLIYWQRRGGGAPGSSWSYLYMAGLLAGFATGLKPSALVFSAATGLATILLAGPRAWHVTWRALLCGLVGLGLSGGSHALMLWRAFENPVFPLFNKAFHSPWFADANLVSERFKPASLLDALRYPIDLADALDRVGFEISAADIRPVSLIAIACIASLTFRTQNAPQHRARSSRLFWLSLAIFFPAWLYTSGNTRYALQGLLLLGPAIAWVSLHLPGRSAVLPMLAVGLPLAAQGTAAITLNAVRWNERPWSRHWFDLDIPEPLRAQPAYYLSLQSQTYAALATVMPAGSHFTNLIGQNTLDPAGPGWQRVREIRQTHGLPWRTLYAIPSLIEPSGVSLANLDAQDALLSEYGLRIDRSDCQFIILDGSGLPPVAWAAHQPGDTYVTEPRRNVLVSCAVVDAPPLSPAETARRNSIDARMDALELRCPQVFSPAHTVSEQLENQRRRLYVNTDLRLLEINGKLIVVNLRANSLASVDENEHSQVMRCPEPQAQARKVQSR